MNTSAKVPKASASERRSSEDISILFGVGVAG